MQPWQHHLLRIQKLMQTNELVRAENELLSLNREHPDQPELLFELARLYFMAGDQRQGRATLARGLKNAPHHPHGLLLKGMDALQQGKFRAAIKALRQSVKLAPDLALAHYHLGIALARAGQAKDAVQILERAANLDRTHGLTFFELGAQYVQMGDLDKAERALARSIHLHPQHVPGYLLLGQLLIKQNKLEQASQLYAKGCDRNNDDVALLESQIDLLLIRGQPLAAVNFTRRLAAVRPGYPSWIKQGLAAAAAGNGAEAEEAFLKAVQSDPKRWEAHYNLGELSFSQGLYQRARHHFQEAVSTDTDDFKPYNGLGLLLLHLGQFGQETESALEKAHALAPSRPEPMLNLALLYAKQSKLKKAVAFARKVLETDPLPTNLRCEAERLLAQIGQRGRPASG